MDYRRFNDVSQNDSYPLPRIDTCLGAMNVARWFPTFDLLKRIPSGINGQSLNNTPFVTREGTYRFRVIPFELTVPVPTLID